MAKTLMDLLGYVTLTGMIQAEVDGIPDVLPSAYKTKTKKVTGDAGRYTVGRGTRKLAGFNNYGAPARPKTNKALEQRDVKLLHSFDSFMLQPDHLIALRGFTSYEHDEKAKQYVAYQMNHYRTMQDNLRTAAITKVLATGVIYVDADGNMLPSSSGAEYTYDFGVPVSNQGTIATVSGVAGDMSSASTNIPAQIRALKRKAVETTGYELKHCFYGVSVPEYFTNNNYIKEYLAREPTRRGAILKSGDLEPEYTLEGIKFYPAYTAFYEDHNGSVVRQFADDALVFTPDPTDEKDGVGWYDLLEGSIMVPTTINVQQGVEAAVKSMKEEHGRVAYSAVKFNPMSVDIFVADTFMPVLKNPAAVYQLTANA